MQKKPLYKRILLKLSGESLAKEATSCFAAESCIQIAKGIKDFCDNNIQVGVVIGGGNIFRGNQAQALGIDRIPADQMGMLATIINAITLQQTLEKIGQESVVLSAISCPPIAKLYEYQEALLHLNQGRVVIFAGGTGSPYFTTDTAAALRAAEIQADILLKATKVNGIYSKDPIKHADAIRYETISFSEVLAQKLEVLDATAVALCMSAHIPIIVFDMWAQEKLSKVLEDSKLGTLVHL